VIEGETQAVHAVEPSRLKVFMGQSEQVSLDWVPLKVPALHGIQLLVPLIDEEAGVWPGGHKKVETQA
jgi:hypothetical protein